METANDDVYARHRAAVWSTLQAFGVTPEEGRQRCLDTALAWLVSVTRESVLLIGRDKTVMALQEIAQQLQNGAGEREEAVYQVTEETFGLIESIETVEQ